MTWNSKSPKQPISSVKPDDEECTCVRCTAIKAGADGHVAEVAAYESMKADLVKMIDDLGFAVTVGNALPLDSSAAGARDYDPFIYTIGASEHGVPELLCMGYFPIPQFGGIANQYLAEVLAGTVPKNEPFELKGWFEGPYTAWLVPVDFDLFKKHAEQMATIHYEGTMFEDVQFVQIVFGDINNKFPWDPEYKGTQAADGWKQPVYGTHIKPDPEPTIQ